MTLYAAGLRLSEAAQLRIPDIGSQRMQLNIASGKGNKQRLVPLSPRLLTALRVYWKAYRPTDYLFPGQDARSALRGDFDSESDQGRRQESQHPNKCHTARAAPFLRDRTFGSRSRHPDDQSTARSRELHHDDGLSARTTSASGANAQSTRLVAVRQLPKWEERKTNDPRPQVDGCPDSAQLGWALRRRLSTTGRAASPKHVGQAVAVPHGGFRRSGIIDVATATRNAWFTTRVVIDIAPRAAVRNVLTG